MRGAVITLIARRMASSWPLLCCVFVTAFATAALLAALAGFASQALPQALHRRLAADPASSVSVIGVVDSRLASTDTRAIGTALRMAFGTVPVQLDESVWSDPLSLPASAGALAGRPGAVAAPARIRQQAVLVAGTWPVPPGRGEPIAAAFPAPLADALHVAPGAVIALRDLNTGKLIRLRVSGTYRQRDPASPYWDIDQIWTCGGGSQGCFIGHGPIVVSRAAFGPGGLTVDQASWVALPDAARIAGNDLSRLANRIGAMQSRLQNAAGLGGLVVTTAMPQALKAAGSSLTAARSVLVIGGIQLLLVGAIALVLAARLLASQRDQESAVLGARGAARWHLAGAALAEAMLLAAVAAVAGTLAGGRLAGWVAHGWLPRGVGLPLATITPAAWYAGAVVFGVCVAALLAPALRPVSTGAARLRSASRVRSATAIRAGGDVALIALAVLAVWQLRGYSALSAEAGIDPVLTAAPAVALVAVSVLSLRVLPAAARFLDRAASRARRAGASLASWDVSRRPLRQAGPVLLAVLAVATATLAFSQYQSWRRSASDQAAFAVGSDVRVDMPTPVPAGRAGAIADARRVLAATPVGTGTTSTGGEVLALDARTARTAVLLRPDLSALPAATLWRRVTPREPAPGLPVPGRPSRIRIIASLSGRPGNSLRAAVTISVQDRFGTVFRVPAGTLPADGRDHSLVAVLSATRQAGYPLRLLGLSLAYPLPPASPNPGAALVVKDLSVSSQAGGFAAPFAAGRRLAAWRPAATVSELGGTAQSPGAPAAVKERPPTVTRWQPAAAGAQALAFYPGAAPTAPLDESVTGPPPVAEVTVTAPVPGGAVPGIATRAFLRASSTAVGQTVTASFGGNLVPVTVVAAVAGFPTVTAPGGAVIVDQGAVQDVLASRWDPPLLPAAWWLRTAGGAVPPGLPAGTVVSDRNRETAKLLAEPLTAVPLRGVLDIAVAVALLAAVGFAMSVTARLRAGRVEGALLSALGMSRAAQTARLCAEEVMLAVPAAAAGLAAGVGIAYLLIPAVTPVPAGAPPVLVVLPLAWLAWTALAVAAIPVLAAAASFGLRADPAGQLRTVAAP